MGHQKNSAQMVGPNSHSLNFSHSSRIGEFIVVLHQLVIHNQEKGHAELAVKTSKRIIMDNTSVNDDLNNNKAAQAIL